MIIEKPKTQHPAHFKARIVYLQYALDKNTQMKIRQTTCWATGKTKQAGEQVY